MQSNNGYRSNSNYSPSQEGKARQVPTKTFQGEVPENYLRIRSKFGPTDRAIFVYVAGTLANN
jgi:site-specific recombinase XerC